MTDDASLYARIIGSSWSQIAEPLRRLHTTHATVYAHGRLRIEWGVHPLARLIARMLRLPESAAAVDTQLVVTPRTDGEHWTRTFDGRCLDTVQYLSDGRDLAERFGILEFRFRLEMAGASLIYVQRDAMFVWPIRLQIPAPWAPRVEAREDPEGPDRIHVEVRVLLPRVGVLISYSGIVQVSGRRP
jgi:uncharacterized protein DUF4166